MKYKNIACILAAIGCLVSAYLAGEFAGFELGYDHASDVYHECSSLQFSGGTAYDAASRYLHLMSGALAAFVVTSAIRDHTIWRLFRIALLLGILFSLFRLHLVIREIANNINMPFYDLLRSYVPLIWLETGIIMSIVVAEAVSFVVSLKEG